MDLLDPSPPNHATATPAPSRPVATPERPAPSFRLEVRQATDLALSVQAAQQHLLGLQQDDGHWCAELEGDTILESEYLMLLWFLGRRPETDPRFEQGCRTLRDKQLEEGGWAIFPGGDADPSPSVKAYFVLKLCGDDPEAEHMVRARASIERMGGIAATNSFTKLYLAVFGQWRWRDAPAVPPELILLPTWFPINIYEMSSWSRAIVVPLAMIWALKPRVDLPFDLAELDTVRAPPRRGRTLRERSWFTFFRGVDRCLKVAESLRMFTPVRGLALRRCERWTAERLEASAGLGAIFPAIVNAAVAMRCRGYGEDHPYVRSQLDELEKLEIVEPESGATSSDAAAGEGDLALRVEPCKSPVWDTALTLNALLESGVDPRSSSLQQAGAWLLDKECRHPGDWQIKNRDVEPSGWFFEYENAFYPDCDDTAEALVVFSKLRFDDAELEHRREQAVARALRWQLSMQNRDGGWGAFDRECNHELLTYIPFADHNAMIDPSTVDVTSRSIEALVAHLGPEHEAVGRAIAFVERDQEEDGSWYGRWGSNYIYGTWLALCALGATGRRDSEAASRGVDWLLGVQQADGGWGESLHSYVDSSRKGGGPSTAAQTAWALMGLLAVRTENLSSDESLRGAVERAVAFLTGHQNDDGGWTDTEWTGTGFPAVFYLRYHFYDRYFPLQALATARRALDPR